MSEAPSLIVVAGVPVRDAIAEARKWSSVLFVSQLIYFIFNLVVELYYGEEENTSNILTHAFTFCVCGVYLPLALYNNAKRKNLRILCFISILILLISLMTLILAINSLCTFYDIRQICEDCQQDFQEYNRTCDMVMQGVQRTYTITVTQDECDSVPEASVNIARHVIQWFVALIGCIAACKVQSIETTSKMYANALPAESVSVVGIVEQPVVPQV